MLSSKTDRYGRRIQDRGNASLSQDAVKLLKTQDAGYLKTMIQQTRRTREKMEQGYLLQSSGNVQTLGGEDEEGKGSQHIVFVDDQEAQQALRRGLVKDDKPSKNGDIKQRIILADDSQNGLDPLGKGRMDPRQIMRQKEEELLALKRDRALRKLRKRKEERRQSRLSALKTRERDLLAAERGLDHQRARMNDCIGGVNKAGVKWKVRERKR